VTGFEPLTGYLELSTFEFRPALIGFADYDRIRPASTGFDRLC
jgi:hypothetical protein